MAILRYKKDGNSNSIREMPVISSVYIDYVVENTGPAQTITLTPSTTTSQTGAGAFENVIARVKFLETNPTYAPALTQQTYTFSTLYGNNGFPSAITISAIPTTTTSFTPSEETQTRTFNTTTGLPTTVTVNPIPSNYLNKTTDASTPPTTTTITTPSGSITINAGYYSNDITISANITDNGNIKNYLAIKPSTKDTIWPTGYYTGGGSGSSANGKLNIQTGTLTLTANNTYTPSTTDGAIWGDFFPTSITVEVPESGTDNSNGTSYTILYNNRNKIPDGYRVYGSGSSDYVTGTMNSYTHPVNTITNLTAQGATRTIEAGWHDGNETIEVNLPDITPSTNIVLYPSQWMRTMPAGYYGSNFSIFPATGSKTITSNGTYNSSDDGYYYSSVTVDVQSSTGSGIDTTISSTYAAGANDIRSGKRAYVNGSLIYGSLNPTSVLESGTAGSSCSYTLYQNGILYYYTSSDGINGEVTSASSIVNKDVVTRIIFGAGINFINADFSNFNNIEKIEFVSHHEPLRIYGTYFHYKASTDGSTRILVLPANLIQLGDNCFVNSYLNQVIFLGWRYDTSIVYYGSMGSASAFSGCTIALMKFPWANNSSCPSYIYPPFGATINSYAYNSNPTGY